MDETLSPIVEGKVFRIWSDEVPWFFQNIREKHKYLWKWAEIEEPRFRELSKRMRLIEWGTMNEALIPHFEAAIADLDAGRVDRPDGYRILPKWSDGSYRRTSA